MSVGTTKQFDSGFAAQLISSLKKSLKNGDENDPKYKTIVGKIKDYEADITKLTNAMKTNRPTADLQRACASKQDELVNMVNSYIMSKK